MSASVWMIGVMPYVVSRTIDVPEFNVTQNDRTLIVQRLPSEAIGNASVVFSGVNAGSEIRVFYADGTDAAGVETCVANQSLIWSVFGPGNVNNTVTIRIVHPDYRIKEFTYTSAMGAQTIAIQQDIDRWYSNP